MQTSGTFGGLSDGMKKTMTSHMKTMKPAPAMKAKAPAMPKMAGGKMAGGHRRGGHADHKGR